MNKQKDKTPLSIEDIKKILSEEEYAQVKHKIEKAEKTLDEIQCLLSSALFLKNGKLSTGTIDYAAFRVETLSLFFELASANFNKSSKSGPKAYDDFLNDLGDKVGFSFAKDLINKLKDRNLFLEVENPKQLIKLWALYENDTGAGITTLKSYTDKNISIQLKNNPLRRVESKPHAHCGFYKSYIKSLLNAILSSRSRILQECIEGVSMTTQKVKEVVEKPDTDDNCVFIAHLCKETLTNAFDYLYKAYEQFYNNANEDYSPCASQIRASIVSAQLEVLEYSEGRPPRNFYKIFRKILPRESFKIMDEVYQVVSKYIHSETNPKVLTRSRCWQLLCDTRRTIYTLDALDLSSVEKEEIKEEIYKENNIYLLRELVKKFPQYSSDEIQEIDGLLNQLKDGKLAEEKNQEKLLTYLNKIGEKAWELGKPILTNVLSAAIKAKYEW